MRARLKPPPPPMPVTLHIYNVGTSRQIELMNKLLKRMSTGAFHCGVEVFGVEWSFSDFAVLHGVAAGGTGIFSCMPRHCPGHTYSESIPMGNTGLAEAEINDLMNILRKEWPVFSYNILRRNCCHFSHEFCKRLGVGGIPNWVMNLAGVGAALATTGDTFCCKSAPGQSSSVLCCGPNGSPNTLLVEGETSGEHDERVDIVEAQRVLLPRKGQDLDDAACA